MRFSSERSNVTCGTVAGDMLPAPVTARCNDMGSSTMQQNDDPGTRSLQAWNSVIPVQNFTEHRAGKRSDAVDLKKGTCREMVMIEPWRGRFRNQNSGCRLVVSRSGLTSPLAPFRVGIAPTDSFLKTASVAQLAVPRAHSSDGA